MSPVFCDTICVWALYFRDSKYRGHVLRLLDERGLLVPEVCLMETAYPIFEAKGAGELARYATFLEGLSLVKGLEVVSFCGEDLTRALRLVAEEPDSFVDEQGNLSLYDALVAAAWERVGVELVTTDKKLIEFGKKRGLRAIRLRKSEPSQQP